MEKNRILKPTSSSNDGVATVIQKEKYTLFAPIAGNSQRGMAKFNEEHFKIDVDGKVSMSDNFLEMLAEALQDVNGHLINNISIEKLNSYTDGDDYRLKFKLENEIEYICDFTAPRGPQGDTGPQGPKGIGVPDGGTEGQVLVKTADGTAWEEAKGGNSYKLSVPITEEYGSYNKMMCFPDFSKIKKITLLTMWYSINKDTYGYETEIHFTDIDKVIYDNGNKVSITEELYFGYANYEPNELTTNVQFRWQNDIFVCDTYSAGIYSSLYNFGALVSIEEV